jgi:hypothetical protein
VTTAFASNGEAELLKRTNDIGRGNRWDGRHLGS